MIPAAGVGFKVRNTDTGEYIVQHINYPTPVDIDTYYTDSTGKLMMPEPLGFGNYELIEQCSAYGYVLTPRPYRSRWTAHRPPLWSKSITLRRKARSRSVRPRGVLFRDGNRRRLSAGIR